MAFNILITSFFKRAELKFSAGDDCVEYHIFWIMKNFIQKIFKYVYVQYVRCKIQRQILWDQNDQNFSKINWDTLSYFSDIFESFSVDFLLSIFWINCRWDISCVKQNLFWSFWFYNLTYVLIFKLQNKNLRYEVILNFPFWDVKFWRFEFVKEDEDCRSFEIS